jgi:hypothetical protein
MCVEGELGVVGGLGWRCYLLWPDALARRSLELSVPVRERR